MTSRSGSKRVRILVGGLISLCVGPLHAQTTIVRGTVTDSQGKPVANAVITLRCDTIGTLTTPLVTRSDLHGTYSFKDVGKLSCRLEASASGLTAKVQLNLTQAQAGQMVAPDLALAAPQQSTPNAVSTPASAAPTFQASGIRGLIDQGGYSAPAGAAAASSLISSMADVRRADSRSVAAANVSPCIAAPSLLQAVREHPGSVKDNQNLAEFYLAHGQAAHALPYLKSAHQAAPMDTGVLLDLARAQIAQELFADARATLSELPSISTDSQAHVMMAQAAEGLGMFAEAATQYSRAQEHDLSIDNIFGQGYELILAANLPAAEEVFRNGLKRFPRSATLLIGKGVAEYLGGLSAASVATFLAAIAVDPGDARAYAFLAQAYLISGEHAGEVLATFRDHLARSSGDGTAYYLLALALSHSNSANSRGNDAEIAALLHKAITLDPNFVMAHLRLGIVLARESNNEAAAAEFEQVLHLQPTLAEAHFRLAGIYRKLGRTDAAADEMNLFRSTRPSGEAQDDDTGVDLRQFISVMHQSERAPVAVECN